MTFQTLPATVEPPVGVEDGGTGSTSSLAGGKVMQSVGDSIQESSILISALSAVTSSPPQAVSVNKWVYVSEYGNDTTGDGTYNKPWATTTKAMTSITDAAASNRYAIHIRGTISEATVYLKPYIWYYGDNWGSSRVNATSTNAVELYPGSFTAGNSRCGMTNVYMTGSTGINLDFVAQTAAGSHVIEMDNLGVNGAVVINSRNTNQYFQWRGAFCFSSFTLHGCLGFVFNSLIVGNIVVDNGAAGVVGQGLNVQNSFIIGSVTITGDGTHNNEFQITTSTINGSVSVSGAGTNFTTDAVSVPLKASISVSAGATFTRTNDVYPIAYTPTTSGNWPVVPNNLQDALDYLASRVEALEP